ncbi:MAG: cobalamin [Paenibacillus sp.]|nr:cobalamin [Paenibacillus sp.]
MSKTAVLVISHGSRSADWVRLIDQAVAEVRLTDAGQHIPIVSSFLELIEGRLIQDGLDALERTGVTDIVVVPLFVSYGSTHVEEIRYALGDVPRPSFETDMEPLRFRANIHVCPPLDDDPIVAHIVFDHLREMTIHPEREHVLLIGHGSELPEFYAKWKTSMDTVARNLQKLGGYAQVSTALLLPDETQAFMRAHQEEAAGQDVIVAPLFLSSGYFTNTVIPSRLNGFTYRYNGKALLPHAAVSRWMERTAGEALKLCMKPT